MRLQVEEMTANTFIPRCTSGLPARDALPLCNSWYRDNVLRDLLYCIDFSFRNKEGYDSDSDSDYDFDDKIYPETLVSKPIVGVLLKLSSFIIGPGLFPEIPSPYHYFVPFSYCIFLSHHTQPLFSFNRRLRYVTVH